MIKVTTICALSNNSRPQKYIKGNIFRERERERALILLSKNLSFLVVGLWPDFTQHFSSSVVPAAILDLAKGAIVESSSFTIT
jgi:hypothetical protein